MLSLRKVVAPLLLGIFLLLNSCTSEAPSRFEQAQQESRKNGAVVKDAIAGSDLNKFFPSSGEGYQRVYTQEKLGFAEAKLKKDGKEVALLSIADTLNNPRAKNKFNESDETLGGYPAAKQGSGGNTVLVGDRFQVKVLSLDPSFSESERQEWLTKFDLSGLSRLQ